MEDANYSYNNDTNTGQVTVNLTTSTNAGYPNNCQQYNDYGHISVPLPKQILNTDNQCLSNVVVTGYNNTITDKNFMINAGESCNYSTAWYHIRANDGIYIQQVNTTNKENAMMGQSSNHIMLDMANLLVAIIGYLQNIESLYNNHKHDSGTYANGAGHVAGSSDVPTSTFTDPPSKDTVNSDISKLTNGENLAGNNYTPYPI